MIEFVDVVVMDGLHEKMWRSFFFFFVSFLVPCMLFGVLLVPKAMAAAEDLPSTAITLLEQLHFSTGQSLPVAARIKDAAGIAEARVYVRFHSESSYVFMRMEPGADNTFKALLPPLSDKAGAIEYFILAVNRKQQVVRSTSYTAVAEAGSGSLQGSSGPESSFLFNCELPQSPDLGDYFQIPDQVSIETVGQGEKYGLVGGVYSPDEFEGYDVLEGYFGGFLLESSSGTVLPVKGLLLGPPRGNVFSNQAAPDSGTGQGQSVVSVVGPNIAGDNWSGAFHVFTYTPACSCYVSIYSEYLTASVTQDPYQPPYYDWVTITTSRPSLGHYLRGAMDNGGSMLIYDQYDGEDWSTHFGPATATVINIYDYVVPPSVSNPKPDLNSIKITRFAPPPKPEASSGFLPGIYHLLLGK